MKNDYDASDYEIARSDGDECYENWGVVACVNGNEAAIKYFSHCSCYGTYGEDSENWDWEGTPDELVELAKKESDITLDRPIREDDNDYEYWHDVYQQVIEWDKSGRPVKK